MPREKAECRDDTIWASHLKGLHCALCGRKFAREQQAHRAALPTGTSVKEAFCLTGNVFALYCSSCSEALWPDRKWYPSKCRTCGRRLRCLLRQKGCWAKLPATFTRRCENALRHRRQARP